MSGDSSLESQQQPPYRDIEALLAKIEGPNGEACKAIYADYRELFEAAPGSSYNHQTWPGGYVDHVTDAMNIASTLYDSFAATGRQLPFSRSDALLVLFLHDLEKPFKFTIDQDGNLTNNPAIPDKKARAEKRLEVIAQYGIELNEQQSNAMKYVEGIRDADYTPNARIMGELAAFCHLADSWSARGWDSYPKPEGQDEWHGARRANPAATNFVLRSNLEP